MEKMREEAGNLVQQLATKDAELATLRRALEMACEYLADNNASKIDWKKYFTEQARKENV